MAEATRQLQTLVRLYYLRHGFDDMNLFIVVPLILIGFTCTDAIDDRIPTPALESLRSTLILVAKGLYSQRHNHYLAEALFRVVRGRMRQQEAALLKDTVTFDETKADEKEAMVQTVKSSWPVTVVKKMDEVDSLLLKNLVENYAHLNVEDQSETS